MIPEMQTRLTAIEIDLDALLHNFLTIQRHVAPALVMPIVKDNAYGHGIISCARHLEKNGAQWLGVALLEEGILLRKAGISVPLVVLGGILGRQIIHFIEHDLDITAASIMKLEAIEDQARSMGKRARVHLEIDTGMERTGVHYYTAHTFIERTARTAWCDIVGVFSHFATAESADCTFASTQLDRFLESIKLFEKYGMPLPLRHISASGSILQLPKAHLDIVRPGLLLYGIAPAHHLYAVLDLRPVMSLRSRVVYFKVVKAGTGVGYGLSWVSAQDTRVVTVPIGYGDGYSRAFARHGHVLIRGKRYPIIGSICMDQFMVDIGTDEVYNDDEVVLIGAQGSETITIQEVTARVVEGNVRETMTGLNMRIPRIYTTLTKQL
ncbi:MAG: alanine racemase [Candidatus Babeliaceae bacterium]